MIKGRNIYLTTIEEGDLEQLRLWRNLPEYRKHFREYREISSTMQRNWFEYTVNGDNSTIMFAIRMLDTDELAGCCGLCYINWVHRHSDLSLYIGKNGEYIDKEGIAEESCRLLFGYGFSELGLNKIWTEIYEFDSKKFELYKKFGFHEDGFLREQYFYEGRWWGSYMLSLLSHEFSAGFGSTEKQTI